MQRKFRCPDDTWQAFCDRLPSGVTPSEMLRNLVKDFPIDGVVTVSEAAEIYGCSDRYIRKLCTEGKLICRRSNDGVWLILKSSLNKSPNN